MSEKEPLSQNAKDIWFYLTLGLSTVAIGILFWPYLYLLLFAAVVVVVTWPIYQKLLFKCQGKPLLASCLMVFLLAVVIFVPVGVVLTLFIKDGIEVAQRGMSAVQAGELETALDLYQGTQDAIIAQIPWMQNYLPDKASLWESISGPIQSGALATLDIFSKLLPALLETTVNVLIGGVIFIFTLVTLYMEGPAVIKVVRHLSPMEDTYEDHLFEVFREFANNIVIGSIVTAALQGLVAAIGYAIGGSERVLFLGILTAVLSFIPFVGAGGVGISVGIYLGFTNGWGYGIFVIIWSLVVTGTVDNVVKPMLLRGNTNIHPLLIFLSVFGGMTWMGIPGALVGPVIVALFLALYTIYKEDYLQINDPSLECDG